MKDVPGHAVDACSNTLVSGHNGFTGGPETGHHQGGQHGLQQHRRQSHDPSVDRSYGDGLNCGYMQERWDKKMGSMFKSIIDGSLTCYYFKPNQTLTNLNEDTKFLN